jgi:hypothetical protein
VHTPSGRPARWLSARSSSCSSRVLACFSFDPFCQWIFVARSSRTVRTRVLDGPCRGGWPAGPSRMVRYGGCSTGGSGVVFVRSIAASRTVHLGLADGPPGVCRQPAQASRTVRPVLADSPPGASGHSAWSSAELPSLSLFEIRFHFGIVWGCS